jgi:hypothetical protein
MKLLLTTAAIVLSGATLAIAQDIKPNNYTIDQINAALESRGLAPLYSSRVLHDDNKGTTITKMTLTSRSSSTVTMK